MSRPELNRLSNEACELLEEWSKEQQPKQKDRLWSLYLLKMQQLWKVERKVYKEEEDNGDIDPPEFPHDPYDYDIVE
jgi:hypothetical protein